MLSFRGVEPLTSIFIAKEKFLATYFSESLVKKILLD